MALLVTDSACARPYSPAAVAEGRPQGDELGAALGRMRAFARVAGPLLLALQLVLPAPVAAEGPRDDAGDVRLEPATLATSAVQDLGRGPETAIRSSGRPYAEGAVLVRYRPGAGAAQRAAARSAVHAPSHRRLSPLARDAERLTLPAGTSVEDAARTLKRHGAVAYAEPDYVVTVDHVPVDDLYYRHLMWGMYGSNSNPASDYGSAAGEAWETYELGSRNIVVGILDTGVDIAHKDLAPNIWTNPGETPGNDVDDDANGYVDDIHGWDFFHDDASVFDSTAADYHGTHVAGTIGAAGNNGEEGVVGVNWAVTMIPMKFIQGEGFTSDAIEALDYLTDLKSRHGLNIVASNNSWGGDEESAALEDAINRGGDAGILFVAAAGNDSADIDEAPSYPAANECVTRFDTGDPRGFDCVISVAAITETGALAAFSNYGATTVDIGAPGQEIASTYPGNNYVYLDGTSMAAPHVTGAIALLASCRSSPTAQFLHDSVISHGAATPSLDGLTVTGDRLHVGSMMADCDLGGPRALITPPAGATDTPAQMRVWFSEPVTGLETGDFAIGGTSTGWSVTQLGTFPDPAGPYFLSVSATSPSAGTLIVTLNANSVTGDGGTGPATPTSVTIVVDRTAPTITTPGLTISDIDGLDGSAIPVRMTWTGADVGAGVKGYDLQYSRNGGAWTPLVSNGGHRSTAAIIFVSSSGTWRFRVRANDWPGHVSSWGTSPTFSPRLVQEGSGAIDYGGSWSTASSPSFSGGKVRYTSTGKRSATYKFSGRAVGLITTMTPSRGVVKIKLDGDLVATVDTSWPVTLYRQVIWSKKFSSVTTHTVKVIVVGGQGRVDIDAFAVLK